jgi:hypothetical protein
LTYRTIMPHVVTVSYIKYGNNSVTLMEPDIFHFNWGVDPTGYQIEEDGAVSSDGDTLLTSGSSSPIFRRNSPDRELRFYSPSKVAPNIHWEFARAKTTIDAAHDFVNAYGVLGHTRGQNRDIDSAFGDQIFDDFFSAQHKVRAVMALLKLDETSGKSPAVLFNENCAARMTILIDPANPKRPSVKIIPTTLLSYIWLRVSEDVTGGVRWKKCEYDQCINYFPVGQGAGTSRRRFCEPKCKVYWNRQK